MAAPLRVARVSSFQVTDAAVIRDSSQSTLEGFVANALHSARLHGRDTPSGSSPSAARRMDFARVNAVQ